MDDSRSKAEELFHSLIGEDVSNEQRLRILKIQRVLGIPENDALWCVIVALSHFEQLYDKIPERICEALETATSEFQKRARVVTLQSHAEAMEGLSQSVRTIFPQLATEVTAREKWKWTFRSVVAIACFVTVFVTSLVTIGYFSYGQGFAAGAGADRDVVNWATSPSGTNARALDGRGRLQSVTQEEIQWMTSLEGRRGFTLARDGTVAKLDDIGIEWLLSEDVKLAREFDKAGLLDSMSLEKLRWVAGGVGRRLYDTARASAALDMKAVDLIWLLSEKGTLARALDKAGLLAADTKEKLAWLESRDGQAVYGVAMSMNGRDWRGFMETVEACSKRPRGLLNLGG